MELEQIALENCIPATQIWEVLSPDDDLSVRIYLGQVPEGEKQEEEAMVTLLPDELVEEDYESEEQINTLPEDEDTSFYRSEDETQEYNRRYETEGQEWNQEI